MKIKKKIKSYYDYGNTLYNDVLLEQLLEWSLKSSQGNTTVQSIYNSVVEEVSLRLPPHSVFKKSLSC